MPIVSERSRTVPNKKVLETRVMTVTIDNVVAPPPMMRENKLSIEYREDMCRYEDITSFVQYLIEDYLHFRHPFIEIAIEIGRCYDIPTTLLKYFPKTDSEGKSSSLLIS